MPAISNSRQGLGTGFPRLSKSPVSFLGSCNAKVALIVLNFPAVRFWLLAQASNNHAIPRLTTDGIVERRLLAGLTGLVHAFSIPNPAWAKRDHSRMR
jgi:hypothetical protein